jgi:hypothetical protein
MKKTTVIALGILVIIVVTLSIVLPIVLTRKKKKPSPHSKYIGGVTRNTDDDKYNDDHVSDLFHFMGGVTRYQKPDPTDRYDDRE